MRDIDSSPTDPEVGEFADDLAADGDTPENATKTGTTTVGLTTDDGVIIATDRRASLGGRFVSNKNVVKVEQVHPTAAMTLVGLVGAAQNFIDTLRAEASLYESRRREEMNMDALAKLASNFAREGPFYHIHPILGGVDEEGSHVYTIDPAGGRMEQACAVTGSGMMIASGFLEQEYHEDLSLDEARRVATEAVESASERDTASGNGLALATITSDGVDIETYDGYPDADNL